MFLFAFANSACFLPPLASKAFFSATDASYLLLRTSERKFAKKTVILGFRLVFTINC
jgi:hypothetical protein